MEGIDHFDRLPDEIVRSIFNKLVDAKSLCFSMVVCKRFQSIAPQVDEIFLPIPRKKTVSNQETQKGFFKSLVTKALIKPLHFITQIVKPKSKTEDNSESDLHSFYIPNDVLKPFDEMRKLHLRLPCHGFQKHLKNSKNPTTFLKWKAEFGGELKNCVMLGAKDLIDRPEKFEIDEKSPEMRMIGDDDLKMRIIWTISCLIAASARHYLVQETVKTQKTLHQLVVSDESEQGRLCMNKEQIEELKDIKEKGGDSIFLDYRSKVPALRMKMWYLEKLELPECGKVMEGATLVVLRPVGCAEGRSDAELVAGSFGGQKDEKVVEEALRKLMVAKKCYTLEMNSF